MENNETLGDVIKKEFEAVYKQAVKDTAKEIYKKGKELDKDFDMTGLGEYILANFLTDVNGVEVE